MDADKIDPFQAILDGIVHDPDNAPFTGRDWRPIYTAGPRARILVVGQAPGKSAQESGTPWNDASGARLIEWLGVREQQFRDPDLFAMLPMDFYYPGKGTTGDLPPRAGFAHKWHPPLLELMPQIQLTLLIGRFAQAHYLGPRARKNLTETVHAFDEYLPETFPLVHPSPLNFRWQSRNPWYASELLPALQCRVAAALR